MIDDLTAIAKSVREALENYSYSDPAWADFPKGFCGQTSQLLGRLLIERGYPGVTYVCGEWDRNGKHQSHAWIEVQGVIVDITGDQFERSKIFVGRDSSWHGIWTRETPRDPICKPEHWPAYPLGAWQAIAAES